MKNEFSGMKSFYNLLCRRAKEGNVLLINGSELSKKKQRDGMEGDPIMNNCLVFNLI